MQMILRKILVSLFVATLAVNAGAQWVKVDDFENGNGAIVVATAAENAAKVNAVLVEDPAPTRGGNGSTAFFPSVEHDGTQYIGYFYIPFPEGTAIPADGKGTLFYRLYMDGASLDANWGATGYDFAVGGVEGILTNGFNNFEAQLNHNSKQDGSWAPRNASVNTATDHFVVVGDWYNVWMQIDNVSRTTKLYVQGPDDAEPVHVKVPVLDENGVRTGEFLDAYNFRFPTNPSVPIIAWYYGQFTPTWAAGDANLVDDIHVVPGIHTTVLPSQNPTPSDAEFDNISTRGNVGTGPNRLIGGFVVRGVEGTETGTVLVRAIGPGLGALGLAGTLVDPILTIFKDDAIIFTNDNWEDNANAAEIVTISATIGAFALEAGSADSALLLSLEPGAYTAQISGKDGGTGIALVEVYAVD